MQTPVLHVTVTDYSYITYNIYLLSCTEHVQVETFLFLYIIAIYTTFLMIRLTIYLHNFNDMLVCLVLPGAISPFPFLPL